MLMYFDTLSKYFEGCKIFFSTCFDSILIALAHPNSTEKLHRLDWRQNKSAKESKFIELSTWPWIRILE